MKKRIVAFLLVFSLLLSILPFSAFAAEGATTIKVDSVEASPGSTVAVNVSVSSNPGILSAALSLSWDEGLTLIGAENGEAFGTLDYIAPSQIIQNCMFIWSKTDIKESDIKNGTILTLTFQVNDNAAEGRKYGIYLSYIEGDIYDREFNDVNAIIENGGITAITYIPGDANGDKKVNTRDAITILRYYSDGCKTDPNGYNIALNPDASDVNDDGKINTRDAIMILRYYSDGCKTDPNGYNVVLKPSMHKACTHVKQETVYKAATCTENGNIAYWYCESCNKYYNSADGTTEITLSDTVIPATGHTVIVDEAVAATYTSTGLTEGSHCSVCHEVLVAQEVIPMHTKATGSIVYYYDENDLYLMEHLDKVVNPNESTFVIEDGYPLSERVIFPGYKFEGWYDGPSENSKKITRIEPGTIGTVELYAHFTKYPYKIFLNDPINGDRTLNYTVDEGATLGKNPEWSGYVFMGWSDKTGSIVKSIPEGTTGNINLTANWTSERNKTVPVNKLGDPMILHDDENGQILFTYEIGEIRNVPLYTIKDFLNVVAGGVTLTESITSSQSITEGTAEQIAETVSKATTDTSAWTLSDTWNKTTEESWDHMEEVGEDTMTSVTNYQEQCIQRGQTPTYVIGSGNNTTYTYANGTTAKTENNETSDNSAIPVKTEKDGFWDNYWGVGENMASTIIGFALGDGELMVSGMKGMITSFGGFFKDRIDEIRDIWSPKNNALSSNPSSGTGEGGGFSAGGGEGGGGGSYGGRGGADDIISTISTSAPQTTTYYLNTNAGYSLSNTTGHSETTSHLLHNLVRDTHHYGEIYSEGQTKSESESHAESVSDAREYGSTVTYSNAVTTTVTRTYSNEGAKSGYYRIVCAGTAHVFAVVGYDIASSTFYTYTYTVMDDETKEFLDYSKDGSFTDYENGVLPFEVPGFVLDYVDIMTRQSDGIIIDDATGTVVAYEPSETAKNDILVFVPSYASVTDAKGAQKAVKITNIADGIFKNNGQIECVILSCFNESIPNSAFENCSNLKFIAAANHASIGNSAFAGCTNLEEITVSDMVTSIGTNAFAGVNAVTVEAENWNVVNSVLSCGAGNVKLTLPDADKPYFSNDVNISVRPGITDMLYAAGVSQSGGQMLTIPSNFHSFDVIGAEGSQYSDLQIVSNAEKTGFYNLSIRNNGKIPVISRSANTLLNDIQLENTGVCLNLDAPATELTLFGTNKLISGNNRAAVMRSTNMNWYDPKVVGKLSMVGNLYVWGNLTGTRALTDYLTFNPGEVIQINEAQYYALLNGTVVTFVANGGTCIETSREVDSGEAIGTLPVPTRTGYDFIGWFTLSEGGTQITAQTIVNDDAVYYAHWSAKEFTVNWEDCTGCTIVVTRTASPSGHSTGTLTKNSKVYYGDTLSITYTATENYTIKTQGKTSITVEGNVTAADIYATAECNEVLIGTCSKTAPLSTNTILTYYVEYYKVGKQIRVKGWVYDPSNPVPVLNLYGGWNGDTSHEGFYNNLFDIGAANKSGISFAATGIPSAAQGHMFDFLIPVELSNGCRIAVQTAYANEGGFAVKIADSVVFTGNNGIIF